ncbi:2-hydroxyacyl-CoA dehydratase family protein [Sphingomonas soli]|uniref:2-hydroxyacyl-CoA dehydratase family protein n=1 Tax=Sphingomonas soli TaxID=266127 RepID=UPI00083714C6|nr:2-hydroxyacyl-CoA dehydratase family protein [Sphingomonas soli]
MSAQNTSAANRRRIKLPTAGKAKAYHRQWFDSLREQVGEGGPFALASIETPFEILRAMDIPFVPIQWWSSIVSVKQKAPEYLNRLRAEGYPDDRAQYFGLGLASSYDEDPASIPWGGFPKPTLVMGDPRDDNLGKIYEIWARRYGATYFEREMAIFDPEPRAWWDEGQRDWEGLYPPEIVDILLEESKGLIRHLEMTTGKTFSETRFRRVLDLINEQEEHNRQARDLIAHSVPAPISVSDSFTSVMLPQWHRGTEWARDAAAEFHNEIRTRIDDGEAVCPDEEIRLGWIGAGLWFNVDFYDAFIDRYKAVFVWSMYLGLAADGYAKYGSDPLRTLSARYAAFNQHLTMEPWGSSWLVKEARHNQLDAMIGLGSGNYFVERAFRDAGIPILFIPAHNVDNRKWDGERMLDYVSAFIENEVRPRAEARRASMKG